MKRLLVSFLVAFFALAYIDAAVAQSTSFGWTPAGTTQNMNVTSSSSTLTLSTNMGNSVLVQNIGANTAYIKTTGGTATTSDFPLQAGWGILLNLPPGQTVAAVTSSSSTTLTFSKGLGATVIASSGSSAAGVTSNQGTAGTNAQAWWVRIGDATTGPVKVQPASTTPAATDIALTTSLSPNSAGLITTGTSGSPGAQVVTVQGVAGGTGLGSYSDYPVGATPIVAASGNVAASTATATLAGASGKTTYLTGFVVTGSGATAASVISCTVSNLIGSVTWTFSVTVPAGVTTAVTPLTPAINKPIPASATNTSIAVSCPSFGAGNTNAAVFAQGYQL